MPVEKWFIVIASGVLFTIMLLRPRLLAVTRLDRGSMRLHVNRAIGALGLLGIAVMLIARYLNG